MRGRLTLALCLLLALNAGGCAIIEKETTNRGGYLDDLLDRRWLKADSKQMRALRAFAMQVSLARVATVSAKNDQDRQLLAIRLGALTQKFVPVYLCAFKPNPLREVGARNDPCFYFDSAMVDYSTGLFDLALIALPIEDAKNLITSAAGSVVNPINLLDVLTSLLSIGQEAIKYGRVVGALYRDTIELEVQVWLSTPEIDGRPFDRVTPNDVAMLRGAYESGNDNMSVWLNEIGKLRERKLEPIPHPRFIDQLKGLQDYLCDLITKDPASLKICREPLIENIKPRSVLAPLQARSPVARKAAL